MSATLREGARRRHHGAELTFFTWFIALAGALFFAGGDLLLIVFAFTLAHVFLVLGAYAVHSPYSHIGAERELIQVMAYEPMIILAAVGLYMVSGSFYVADIAATTAPAILYLPGVFLGLAVILTIKLRKSPFDISTSHHAHQEIVKGITTEFSGSTLGQIEIAHWYENVFLLGLVYLFFAWNPVIGVVAVTYIGRGLHRQLTARVMAGSPEERVARGASWHREPGDPLLYDDRRYE